MKLQKHGLLFCAKDSLAYPTSYGLSNTKNTDYFARNVFLIEPLYNQTHILFVQNNYLRLSQLNGGSN